MPASYLTQSSPTKLYPAKRNSLLGAASVVVAAVALLIFWIPQFGILAVVPALLAALLALLGDAGSLLGGGTRIQLPIAGAIMAVIAFVVPVARSGIVGQAIADTLAKAAAAAAAANGPGPRQSPPMSASIDGVQVRVASARVATVEVKHYTQGTGQSREPQLQITLDIRNISSSRTVKYRTWASAQFTIDRGFATLVDDKGIVRKRVTFGWSNQVQGRRLAESIEPGTGTTDVTDL